MLASVRTLFDSLLPNGMTETEALLVILVLVFLYALFVFRRKRFYFVRHGETLLNKEHIKQGADGGLSPSGIEQVRRVGQAFRNLRITEICSSSYARALESARLMQETLKVPIHQTPLLAERRNPKEVLGKHTDDPEVRRIMSLIEESYHEDGYRFSDEENFEDFMDRAKQCLAYLERRGGSQIAVVTHHAFLKALLAYLLYRERLHASDYVKLSYFNTSDNGGVSVCDYYPLRALFSKTHGWEIVTFNQHIDS